MLEYLSSISKQKVIKAIETGVFAIRWMLVPLYVGLVAALALYIVHFTHEVVDMCLHIGKNTELQDVLMLFILELVDMTMISQLVVMTIQGGYAIFIRPFDTDGHITLPQWLKHGLGTSEQKIKLGMSIMGIMMVQLLKNFIAVGATDAKGALLPHISQADLWMREQMLGGVALATLMFCVFNILMHPDMLRKSAAHDHTEHKDDHQ